MIISRTPYRISFFGGGTDYPGWFRENGGGAVLNTSINKYCYISCRYLPPFFKHKYLIRYRQIELVNDISEINHPSVRESLKFAGIDDGVEMNHSGDLPARSGIGSSSSFTVGLLNTLSALKGKMLTKRQLAMNAICVEQEMIKENVGSQDQVAAAFGGLNKIEFGGDEKFYVQPVTIGRDRLILLQNHLMLFFTGISRTASEIAFEQIKKIPFNRKRLSHMKDMVDKAVGILNDQNRNIEDFGRLLGEAWKIKRSLTAKISTDWIDGVYEDSLRAGALGGKLCGAGGGGFLLLFVPPQRQTAVKKKLDNMLYVPFRFETLGSQIILYEAKDFV